MRQRLRLAFALLHRPSCLLLDEPGSHLDLEGRDRVDRIVHEHGSAGIVVLATNDPREWELAQERIELRARGLGHSA
jgi:heme exporter protein A